MRWRTVTVAERDGFEWDSSSQSLFQLSRRLGCGGSQVWQKGRRRGGVEWGGRRRIRKKLGGLEEVEKEVDGWVEEGRKLKEGRDDWGGV